MGGPVAVTLREPDGTEHRMCRWTNALPWFVNNMKFVNKEPGHISEYLKQWNEMEEDWKLNKEKGKLKFAMTEMYAPYPFLAPSGYGLVLLDMKENMILSCQGYCKFGRMHTTGIALDINPSTLHDPNEETDDIIAKGFFDAGRAIVQRFVKNRGFIDTEIRYAELMDIIKKHGKEFYECQDIKLDLSPFIVREYERCSDMRKDIEKLGFKITDEENKLWEEWKEEMEREQ